MPCNTSRLGQGDFESSRSADVDLSLSSLVLEDDGVRAERDVAFEELVVRRGDLPDEDLGGEDEEDGLVGVDVGAGEGGEESLARAGRGANDRGLFIVDGGQDLALPLLELELAVVLGERREAVVHLKELKLDDGVVVLEELAGELEAVLVVIGVVEGLEDLGVFRESDGGLFGGLGLFLRGALFALLYSS